MQSKLLNMINYCIENVPYYRNRKDAYARDFDQLPLLEKADVRQYNQDFITNEVLPGQLIEEHTSGSTGKPLLLYKTKFELLRQEALLYKHRKKFVASIDQMIPIKFFAANFFSEIVCYNNKTINISCLNLEDASLSEYCKVILSLENAWVAGPPSAIYKLAKFMSAKQIIPTSIKYIELVGELVIKNQRELIESVFGCPVRSYYGSREFNCIAYECAHGNLHIANNHVFVEAQQGELVISALDQYTMPFLRYRLGDNGSVHPSDCRCGDQGSMITDLGGRTTDYIYTSKGRVINDIGLYLIILDMNAGFDNAIIQFQIVQYSYNKFLFRLVLADTFNDQMRRLIIAKMDALLGEPTECAFEILDDIVIDRASKKFKYFISELDQNR